MQRHRRIPLLLLAATTFALAACASDAVDGEPSTTSVTPPPANDPSPDSTAPATTSATTVAPLPGPERSTMATPASSERLLAAADIVLTETACGDLAASPATCGTAAVPADWTRPGGATIDVSYVMIPATSGSSAGTVIPFMGGPGESIIAQLGIIAPVADAVPDSDLLVVDVRGAGRSGALTCAVFDDAPEVAVGAAQISDTGTCGEQIGPERNDYTTVASVLDIESIRRGLDLEDPSLIGFSYGTFIAQTYATLFPDDVRGAVLDGAFPIEQNGWGTDIPTSIVPVLELRCARTAACPDGPAAVAESIRSVAESLAATPIDLPGVEQQLTEGAFASIVQFAVQKSDMPTFVETMSAASRGDMDALQGLASASMATAPVGPTSYSPALFSAIGCNDYASQFDFDDDLEIRRRDFEHRLDELPDDEFDLFSKAGWIASGWEEGDMCLAWPAPDIAPELRIPRGVERPDLPVLVVNGDIDTQTPLAGARQVASMFPNSVLLVVPNAGHVALPVSECASQIEFAFLADPVLPDGDACLGDPVLE